MSLLRTLLSILISASILPMVNASENALVVNEIMASNMDSYMSPAVNFDGWIELYNGNTQSFILSGCYLSDDKRDLKKWQMPSSMGSIKAKGFRQIWFGHSADNIQACTFNLDCDGGTLYLSDADGNLILQQKYPEAKSGFSYARMKDGGEQWAWGEFASPVRSNNNGTYFTEQCPVPKVPDGCLFEDSYMFVVDVPEGYTLRYTTDGSTPSRSNGKKAIAGLDTFFIRKNTAYRFRLHTDGKLPSDVVTRSFIKNEGFTLPIISITTKDEYLYDDAIGVTVIGSSSIANWNKDWARPVNFQLLDEDGKMVINQDVNYNVSGAATRSYNQAFKLKGNKKYYGRKYFDYPFFAAKPNLRNQTILCRRGGNDVSSRMTDAAMQVLAQRSGVDIDLQSYQPAIYYINGVLKGLTNIREPSNKDWALANFGYEEEELEVYDGHEGKMKVGKIDIYNLITEMCQSADDEEVFGRIRKYLDIDEYSNYYAQGMWTGRADWPCNNVRLYRSTSDGRYRFVLYDTDFIFYTTDIFERNRKSEYGGRTPDYMYWFWGLLKNESFRRRFAATFSVMGGSIYHPTHCNSILDELDALVSKDMYKAEGRTPTNKLNSIKNTLTSWNATMMDKMKACPEMKLSDEPAQKVKIKCDNSQGRILIEGMPLPYNDFEGTLFRPVTLKAESKAGLRFRFWKETRVSGGETTTIVYSKNPEIEIPDHGEYTLEACFTRTTTAGKLYINEVSAANNIFINEYYKKNDWIEIYNPNGYIVDLNGYYLTNKTYLPDLYQISNQDGTINTKIPAYGYLTIWCDKQEGKTQLHAPFNLPADGGKLILSNRQGVVIDSLTYAFHDGAKTFGRYPDGTDSLYIFNLPSFGNDNRYSSFMEKIDASSLTDAETVLAEVETSHIDMFHTRNYLVLKLNGEPVNASVEIFSTSGVRVTSLNIELRSGGAMIDTGMYVSGVYVARLKTTDGKMQTYKFKK